MVAATLPLPEARARLRELTTTFAATTLVQGDRAGVKRLSDQDLRLVGDLVRAADTLLAALDTDLATEAADNSDLRLLTRALRRMAFLVLTEHNPDQAWFWTPEWQSGERQADADKAAGRFTRYDNGDEFLAALRAERPDVADLR